jgi:hypothetical protein
VVEFVDSSVRSRLEVVVLVRCLALESDFFRLLLGGTYSSSLDPVDFSMAEIGFFPLVARSRVFDETGNTNMKINCSRTHGEKFVSLPCESGVEVSLPFDCLDISFFSFCVLEDVSGSAGVSAASIKFRVASLSMEDVRLELILRPLSLGCLMQIKEKK